MQEIEAHRSAIGRFYAVSFKLSSQGHVSKNQQTKELSSSNSFCKKFSISGMISNNRLFLIICFLSVAVFSGFLVLQLCGDVESNPGPTYNIEKVIMGSFHQGNTRFGLTAGIQCACNSLYALCWSHVKKVYRWNTHDLDHILNEGDVLYKSLGTMDLLSADELPRSVMMSNNNIPVEFLELKTEIAYLRTGEPFLRRIVSSECDEIMFLLFMGGFTTALMKQHNHFYLFDSHSRDEQGLSVAGGTSVLLKFSDLMEVEKYIQVFYLEYRSLEQSYFQLQFVYVNIDRILRSDILCDYQRLRRRLNYLEHSTDVLKRMNETNQPVERPVIENRRTKKKRMENVHNNTQTAEKLAKEKVSSFKNMNCVSEFKSLIKEGPYFICVICHRCLYKRSVIRFDFNNYSSVVNQLVQLVGSYDHGVYICKTCHSKVKKNKVRCQAVSNKLSVE